ncbi:hypothetical protein GCM10011415_13630 [Salipiger pallidus]|uniref:Flagellar motor switch protein n=1 Tax=Salipiger pallidus TaxID=1775170 RepID=A0A8J3EG20_9RHOB|nr:flagellar motor switch protein [Salipiger pallidus]GGG67821.1 hypothetical protein GCM10011415_13630 [Salipiger pallidus]
MSFVIDVAVLVLLVGTLGYAWVVDRRVRKLMVVLREMEPMIGSFSQAVERSESTVSALRAAREAQPRARTETRSETRTEAARKEPAFRSSRERPSRPPEATPLNGKSELVRGFFETVRQREA